MRHGRRAKTFPVKTRPFDPDPPQRVWRVAMRYIDCTDHQHSDVDKITNSRKSAIGRTDISSLVSKTSDLPSKKHDFQIKNYPSARYDCVSRAVRKYGRRLNTPATRRDVVHVADVEDRRGVHRAVPEVVSTENCLFRSYKEHAMRCSLCVA